MISCIETAPGVFELSGRVDVTSVADLRVALTVAVDSCAPLSAVPGAVVRLDVSQLELVDAAGLGALVAAHRRAGRAGLGFVLVDVPDPLSRLLFISRLYRVIRVELAGAGPVREVSPQVRKSAAGGSIPAPSGGAVDTDPFITA
jgi:anti-anti-sigma factor